MCRNTDLHCDQLCGVMVSVLGWSAVDRGFEPRSGKTEDYKIGKVLFAKYPALRRKKTKTADNVSE